MDIPQYSRDGGDEQTQYKDSAEARNDADADSVPKSILGGFAPEIFYCKLHVKKYGRNDKNAQETTITMDVTRYASGIKAGSRRYSKTADPASAMLIVKTINNCFILPIEFSAK